MGNPHAGTSYEVACPHCKKSFRAEPIGVGTGGLSGFKCPHCKLFVPYERAEAEASG